MILKVMLAYADQTSNLSVVYQMKSCCCHICIHCLTCCWLLVCLFFSYVAVRRSGCVHRFYALKALPRLGLVSILCGKVCPQTFLAVQSSMHISADRLLQSSNQLLFFTKIRDFLHAQCKNLGLR